MVTREKASELIGAFSDATTDVVKQFNYRRNGATKKAINAELQTATALFIALTGTQPKEDDLASIIGAL